jgi:hypothetical protein
MSERIPVPNGVLRSQINTLSALVNHHGINGTPQEQTEMANLAGNLNAALATFDAGVTPPPSSTAPWPNGTFGPVVVDSREFRASDPQEIVSNIDASRLYALRCRLPAEPWADSKRLDMSPAEWGGPSVGMVAWFSRVAGDWASKVGEAGGGNQPTTYIDDCTAAGVKGGDVLFFNIAFWSGSISYVGVKAVRTGGHWPR